MIQPESEIVNSWYAVISFEILSSQILTDKEKLILALVGNLQNQKGYCYAGNTYMATILNCSLSNISNSISHLVRTGWLKRKIYRNEKKEISGRALILVLKQGNVEFEKALPDTPITVRSYTPPYHCQKGYLPPSEVNRITKLNNKVIEKDSEQKVQIKKEKKIPQDAPPAQLPDLSKSNLFRQPVIPTIEKVKEYFKGCGGSENAAQQFFDSHSGTGWFYKGSPIQNFTYLANSYIATINKNQDVRTASNQQQYGSYQSKNGKNAQSHTGRTIIHDKP